MARALLLIITSDPRTSHRPAEAIRIAAGIGAWKKAKVALYLGEAAVLALSEDAEAFVDEENYAHYLPGLRDCGVPIYVQRGSPLLGNLGQTPYRFEEVDLGQLAALAAGSASVLRF